MSIEDPRFACVLADGKKVRSYDAIECLLRDGALKTGGAVFLADYDQGALHAADSMWVVQGEFHSPMGGGLAAFLDRAGAAQVAAETRGRVGRLAEFDAPSAGGVGGGGTAP